MASKLERHVYNKVLRPHLYEHCAYSTLILFSLCNHDLNFVVILAMRLVKCEVFDCRCSIGALLEVVQAPTSVLLIILCAGQISWSY